MAPELSLFLGMSKVGLLGFGGGPSFLPLFQAECQARGWVDEATFLEGMAVGNSLPGPITTKLAAWVGFRVAGWGGALAALAGMSLPTALLMLLLAGVVARWAERPWMQGALLAAKPAVVAMTAWLLVEVWPSGVRDLTGLWIAALAFVALAFRVPAALVLPVAMGLGALFLRP